MPGPHDGILGEKWEHRKPDLKISPHTRAKRWSIDMLRPSFMTPRTSAPPPKLRPTAYLDGLRGFAAFLVYWHHHHLWSHPPETYENAFGYKGQYYFVCMPFVRNFFSGGHFAVTIFFVISGYVLSAKPVSLIQAGEYVKLGDNLSSALFRRWIRLMIPLLGTTFLYMTLLHVFNIKYVAALTQQSTWRDEFWWWYSQCKNFTFIFNGGGSPWLIYNAHTWSIPVEFKGSIVIYTSLMAFSRLTQKARLWCQLGLIYYFMWIVDGWYCALFVAGMLMCDLDMLATKRQLPRFLARMEPYKEFIYYHLFVISLYLGGVPSSGQEKEILENSRGWYYLSYLRPNAPFDFKWFYLFWASVFLMASVPRIWWLKRFFETRFCQYLGRISFSLYLVHGPVIWTLGDRVYTAVGFLAVMRANDLPYWVNKFPLSMKGPMGFEPAFWIPQIIFLPLTFWLAEIVTKVFDENSVKFAQWCYNKVVARFDKL